MKKKFDEDEYYLGLEEYPDNPVSTAFMWLALIAVALFLGAGAGLIINADQNTTSPRVEESADAKKQ